MKQDIFLSLVLFLSGAVAALNLSSLVYGGPPHYESSVVKIVIACSVALMCSYHLLDRIDRG